VTAIKALIEQKWPLVRYYVVTRMMIPYMLFLFTFCFFTIGDFMTSWDHYYEDNKHNPENINWNREKSLEMAVMCRLIILVFTLYFVKIEIF
jgi:hypothetical protein